MSNPLQCIFCDFIGNGHTLQEAVDALKVHSANCDKHPAVIELKKLREKYDKVIEALPRPEKPKTGLRYESQGG